jgi:hypothetical protein
VEEIRSRFPASAKKGIKIAFEEREIRDFELVEFEYKCDLDFWINWIRNFFGKNIV